MRARHYEPQLGAWVWPGVGAPVIAVHGFTGDGLDFEALAEHLDAPLVAPDLAGHGGRRGEAHPPAYALPTQAAELAALCHAVAARWERPLLLGYSLGARVLALAAYSAPLHAREALLVGAHPGLQTDAERRQRAADDAALAARAEGDLEAFLRHWQAQPLIASQERQPEPWRQQRSERRRQNSALGLALSLLHAGTAAMPDLRARPAPALPITLLVGEDDSKFRGVSEEWQVAQPGLGRVLLPGGHACHLEATEALAALVAQRLIR